MRIGEFLYFAVLVAVAMTVVVWAITHGSDPSHTAANDFLAGAVRGAVGP